MPNRGVHRTDNETKVADARRKQSKRASAAHHLSPDHLCQLLWHQAWCL
jgi:hypothetical protein